MPTRAELLALADRVEREAPSRELDAEIGAACQIIAGFDISHYIVPIKFRVDTSLGRTGCVEAYREMQDGSWPVYSRPSPNYTTSIDAAASLQPVGWRVGTVAHWPEQKVWHVALSRRTRTVSGDAPTEPQARTAAALRAMAADREANGDG